MLLKSITKQRALAPLAFGCLRGAHSLNVTRGCSLACVYCYARGYPGAPPPGEVHLYRELPDQLARELRARRRRVTRVVFNTASDCFQAHPEVLDVTYRAMRVLSVAGVPFSFLTKGEVPERFLRLFAHCPGLVSATVGLASASPEECRALEPGAAPPQERLRSLQALRAAGVRTEVRADPLVPGRTDGENSLRALFEAVARAGAPAVSVSYLHVTAAVLEQLARALPPPELEPLLACYRGRPPTTGGAGGPATLPSPALRAEGYRRARRAAAAAGVALHVCRCKDPELGGRLCYAPPEPRRERQLPLPLG